MLFHSPLVENVDLRRVGGSASGVDVLSDRFDGCQATPGEKQLGPLTGKGECDSAADGASRSVDHRNLVVQHHLCSFLRLVIDLDTATSGKWATNSAQFAARPVSI